MKCHSCGRESEIERAFTRAHSWLIWRRTAYCPPCQSKRHLREQLLWWGSLVVVAVLLVLCYPGHWLGWLLLNLFLVFLIGIPMILVHELAHALVGYLLEMRIFRVALGYGRVIYAWRWMGIMWEIATRTIRYCRIVLG